MKIGQSTNKVPEILLDRQTTYQMWFDCYNNKFNPPGLPILTIN